MMLMMAKHLKNLPQIKKKEQQCWHITNMQSTLLLSKFAKLQYETSTTVNVLWGNEQKSKK